MSRAASTTSFVGPRSAWRSRVAPGNQPVLACRVSTRPSQFAVPRELSASPRAGRRNGIMPHPFILVVRARTASCSRSCWPVQRRKLPLRAPSADELALTLHGCLESLAVGSAGKPLRRSCRAPTYSPCLVRGHLHDRDRLRGVATRGIEPSCRSAAEGLASPLRRRALGAPAERGGCRRPDAAGRGSGRARAPLHRSSGSGEHRPDHAAASAIANLDGFLTGRPRRPAPDIVRRFIGAHRELFGVARAMSRSSAWPSAAPPRREASAAAQP